jgi:hypothetical protein
MMGWTGGSLDGPFAARAAIESGLGAEFATRVIETVRYGTVIYAAVRSPEEERVFGLVLLAERAGGVLRAKPISEDMGPAEDRYPARILDRLSEPSNDYAREWRERCRARIARPLPRPGETVIFANELTFVNGEVHRRLVYEGGSRFRASSGAQFRIVGWRDLSFVVAS